jgi:hypothetical protein
MRIKMKNVIITQTKNNIKRLLPWFLHHREQGFDTFIFFDDYSQDNLKDEIDKIKKLLEVNIIYMQTDGYGDDLLNNDTDDSNTYRMDFSLHYRICRSYNVGLQMVKQVNNDAWITFIDVDEFLVTNQNKTIVDIIDEMYTIYNHGHFYIQSYDVHDVFDLNGFYPASEATKYRWNHDSRQNTVFHDRGKSIVKASYIDKINQIGNVVHTLFDNGSSGTFAKPHTRPDIQDIRIHHFRKPNNAPEVLLEYDDTLYKFSNNLVHKYNDILKPLYYKNDNL